MSRLACSADADDDDVHDDDVLDIDDNDNDIDDDDDDDDMETSAAAALRLAMRGPVLRRSFSDTAPSSATTSLTYASSDAVDSSAVTSAGGSFARRRGVLASLLSSRPARERLVQTNILKVLFCCLFVVGWLVVELFRLFFFSLFVFRF
jgi:hypothetical protein